MMGNGVKILEDRDRLFIDILQSLGVRKQEATMIAWMNGAGEVSSMDIEKGTGIRQSEVSKILKAMRKNGWVDTFKASNSTKGRPRKIHSLSTSLDNIVRYYELQKLRESISVRESIQRLKELATV
ncbi:MAG: ArsR family transcriptional regulator [Methanotrichaceae archaeon]